MEAFEEVDNSAKRKGSLSVTSTQTGSTARYKFDQMQVIDPVSIIVQSARVKVTEEGANRPILNR
jgi:hypothetical protein